MLDILIRGGWVADGTGNPAYPADVAIEGDRIVGVGPLPDAEARRVIDAGGKIVAPGFIDAHSHTDWAIHTNPTVQSTIRQGITTEIVGNCGFSNAPVSDLSRDLMRKRLQRYAYDGPVTWSTFAEYLEVVRQMGTTDNIAWFVGQNAVRTAAGVGGSDPTEEQIQAMEGYVREAMEAGALGFTTGLEFDPGRLASTDEIVRQVKMVAEYDGIYASHIRNRADRLQPAMDEFFEIMRRSGTRRGQVSHLNVRHNTGAPEGAWERAVGTIEAARREGMDVLTDTTPTRDGIGQLAGILPPWVRAEGPARTAELLKDPEVRQRLRTDCDRYWRFIQRGDWDRVSILQSGQFPELAGKNFVEIAQIWGKDEWECYFDILAAAGPGLDDLWVMGLLFTEEHVRDMVQHPLFMLVVDTYSSTIEGPLAEQSPHPLNYAGMIHYLTYHVREKGTIRLEEAIRKMTSMPATHFGLKDRGMLSKGAFADVVVFDYQKLEEASTLANPWVYARGVEHVLVNGTPVIEAGVHTGARPGRNLLRG